MREEYVTCNMCKVEAKANSRNLPYFHSIDIRPGYGSGYDGDLIHIDLCEDCLKKINNQMHIPFLDEDEYE